MQEQDIIAPAPVPAITTKIAEYSTTAAALGELRGKYEKVIFPVATTAGMKDAVAARAELRNLRVGLEKMRVQIKAPALQRCKDIDQEAKDITGKLTALEDPIDAQIKAHEKKLAEEKAERERIEQARIAAIRAKIEAIRGIPLGMAGETSEVIASEKAALEQFDTSADFAELADEASGAVLSAIRALNDLYHAAKAREDEAVRQAEQAEANRVAALEIERQRAELAEATRKAAAEQAERQRVVDEAAKAECERVAAETKRQLEAQQAEIARAQAAAAAEQSRLAGEREAFELERKAFAATQAAAARAEQARVDAKAEAERVAALPTETVVAVLEGTFAAPAADSCIMLVNTADGVVGIDVFAEPDPAFAVTIDSGADETTVASHLPLAFAYDDIADVLTVEGVHYAGAMFRQLGGMMDIGEAFEIIERTDGVVAIKRLFQAAP
jgi:hypothetical protein